MTKMIKHPENAIPGNFPDYLTSLVLRLTDKKDLNSKSEARNTLVEMGEEILPQLHLLLSSDDIELRKEVAKVVELIADEQSIQALITLLDDDDFDIRWIAAEGLIRIGRKSIIPLLESIRDGKSSYFADKRAHHILVNLFTRSEKEEFESLLLSLDNYLKSRETAPTEAAKALEKFSWSDWSL